MADARGLLQGKGALLTRTDPIVAGAVALALARHGARVVVNQADPSSEGAAQDIVRQVQSHGGAAAACSESLATMEGAQRLITRALETLEGVDILVATDALFQGPRSLALTEEQWETLTAVRLKAIFAATRHASPSMRARRWGRIILLTSPSGQATEGLAEDGVAGFTRTCARDLGRYGVTVNCIALFGAAGPSAVLSPLAEATASLALWLASEEAGHVNGQLFFVASDLIGLLGSPSPQRMLQKGAGRWTVGEIAAAYPLAFGSR